MNILPHKSWHVWNRENREKVARDEKEHDEKEDRKKKRQLEIEQEKRLTLLREKRQRLSTHEPAVQQPEEEPASTAAAPLRHINFFEEEERAQTEAKEHPERVAEAKAAKEKELKQFTTFLGQSAAEKQDTKPWWYQPPPKEDDEGGREGARETTKPKTDKQRKSDRWKERADPLVSVKKHVKEKKEKEEKRRKEEEAANALFKQQQRLRLDGTSSSSSSNKNKKQLIWSRKKDDREGRGSASSVETNAKATKQMSEKELRLQQMREERLQREQKEQLKTRALLQSNSRGGHPQNHAAGYNPQYLTYSRGRTRADSALVRRERGGARLRDDY